MIKPLPGYILVEPIEDNGKSAGGLYLPESAKDKPMKGIVIACGGQTATEGCPVKAGQTVVYKKWTNQELNHEGEEYLIVAFNELLATIE